MAETILKLHWDTPARWHWYSIMRDLEEQGGLADVTINPLSADDHSFGGWMKDGNRFQISWAKDRLMMLSMESFSQELVDAFAAVLEYAPFCHYMHTRNPWVTVEWDKVDEEERFQILGEDPKVSELVRIEGEVK